MSTSISITGGKLDIPQTRSLGVTCLTSTIALVLLFLLLDIASFITGFGARKDYSEVVVAEEDDSILASPFAVEAAVPLSPPTREVSPLSSSSAPAPLPLPSQPSLQPLPHLQGFHPANLEELGRLAAPLPDPVRRYIAHCAIPRPNDPSAGEPCYPEAYCIPSCKVSSSVPIKSSVLANSHPSAKCTYGQSWRSVGQDNMTLLDAFAVEKQYRADYERSWFAVTTRKDGIQAMRHFEILASGTIPLWLDFATLPPAAVPFMPRDLVLQLLDAFVPPKDRVRRTKEDMNNFVVPYSDGLCHADPPLRPLCCLAQRKAFPGLPWEASPDELDRHLRPIAERLLDYTKRHLTCKARAKNLLDTIGQPNAKKVLCLCGQFNSHDGYGGGVFLIGLKELLGDAAVIDYPEWSYIYTDYPNSSWWNMYGQGFTYTRVINRTLTAENRSKGRIEQGIQNREYDVIVYLTMRSSRLLPKVKPADRENTLFPMFSEVKKHYPDWQKRVVAMCGEDNPKYPMCNCMGIPNCFIRNLLMPYNNTDPLQIANGKPPRARTGKAVDGAV